MTGVINSYIGPLMAALRRGDRDAARASAATPAGSCTRSARAARSPPTRPSARRSAPCTRAPVMGTLGSAFLAERMGEPDIIVTDMGGTSFDVSVIRGGAPDLREQSVLERFEIALPMVYVDSIGAGGGSIAWLDDSGGLQVGPQLGGRLPGPRVLRPRRHRADRDRRRRRARHRRPRELPARRRDARPGRRGAGDRRASPSRSGLTVHEAAAGINRIVDSKMADLLRRMSVLRGLDPREFTCFAYGGMGPVHAAAVAREVGMKRLVIPLPYVAPVWSAFGADGRRRRPRLPAPAAPRAARRPRGHRRAVRRAGGHGARGAALGGLRGGPHRAAPVAADEVRRAGVRRRGGARSPARRSTARRSPPRSCEVYEALHGEGSGHPEGGIAITSFIVRARGLTDAPASDRRRS